jgi:hypothetical protein
VVHGKVGAVAGHEDGVVPIRASKRSVTVAKGTVEVVNVERGVFAVRCDAGPFAYFRVSAEELPPVGERVECNETVKPFPRELKVGAREDHAIHVLSAIIGLPRDVAIGLVSP